MDYSSNGQTLVGIKITWKGPDSEITIQLVWGEDQSLFSTRIVLDSDVRGLCTIF